MSDGLLNGENGDGRDGNGRFLPANPGGPGRPKHSGAQWKFRQALLAAISEDDVAQAVEVLRSVMLNPDARTRDRLTAAVELLDRATGKPVQPDLQELVEAAEALVNTGGGR